MPSLHILLALTLIHRPTSADPNLALESTKKKAGRKRGRATRDDDDDTQSPESVAKSARHR
jgi:hypothetical protein